MGTRPRRPRTACRRELKKRSNDPSDIRPSAKDRRDGRLILYRDPSSAPEWRLAIQRVTSLVDPTGNVPWSPIPSMAKPGRRSCVRGAHGGSILWPTCVRFRVPFEFGLQHVACCRAFGLSGCESRSIAPRQKPSQLTPSGSGANGRIWPAMMSAELPEGWAWAS